MTSMEAQKLNTLFKQYKFAEKGLKEKKRLHHVYMLDTERCLLA